jgi:hypothetical protein
MSDNGTLALMAAEVGLLLEAVADAALAEPRPLGFVFRMRDAGIGLGEEFPDPAALLPLLDGIATAYETVAGIIADGPPAPAQLPALLAANRGVIQAVQGLAALPLPPDAAATAAELPRMVLDHFVIRHLEEHHPGILALLVLAGAADPGDPEERIPARLHPGLLAEWMRDPASAFRQANGWGTPRFDPARVMGALSDLLSGIGLRVEETWTSAPERAALGEAGPPPGALDWSPPQLRIPLLSRREGDATLQAGLTLLALLPATEAGDDGGLALVPFGNTAASLTRRVGNEATFRLQASAGATVPFGLVARPGTFALKGIGEQAPPAAAELSASFLLDAGSPTTLFEGAGAALRITSAGVRFALRHDAARGAEVVLGLPLEGRMEIAPPSGDGFLAKLLPAGGASVPFKLEPGWSLQRGVFLDGSGALEGTIPLGIALPGGLRAESVSFGVGVEDGTIPFTVGLTASAALGPFHASVDRVGIRAVLSFDDDGGAPFGFGLGFKPPAGVELSLDAGLVAGGGYLLFDPKKGEYAGVMRLEMERIALTAVGLLSTRMPGGQRGFSLLVMLAAEDFPPVALGMGFTLTGIGGVVGLNRGVAADVLRAGLGTGALDAVLFPDDPAKNGAAIVRGLSSIFPVTPGQHVVGPVARFAWGMDGVLTGEVGLALEFPSPVRLALVGQVKARFPRPDRPLVRLNLDLFGSVDFDRGEALVLATLFDSRLLEWTVSGDAAFYARWKESPVFLLSAGGFHPAFAAPPQLPALERLTLVFGDGDHLRLRMQWYLALTSNTLQHGSRVELHAAAAGFSLDGHWGYDTLVTLDPFGFVIDFTAGVALKWHGHSFAAVQLDGALSGPNPWHVRGKARFKVWRFSKSVSFDRTVGRTEALPPPPAIDPLPLLRKALRDPASWEAALPRDAASLVSLREPAVPGVVRVHPLGSLAVRQTVVPLDVPITQFGGARVEGEPRFTIRAVDLDGDPTARTAPVTELFAPGQFQALTAAERLARPSFERMAAGVRVETDALEFGGAADANHLRAQPLGYRTVLLRGDPAAGTEERVELGGTYAPAEAEVERQARYGAAARAARLRRGAERFRAPGVAQVQVADAGYAVAGRTDLAPPDGESGVAALELGGDFRISEAGSHASYTAVLAYLNDYARSQPTEAGALQVVPAHAVTNGGS